eukprot:scaffold42680_cov67-Phaeocystis_antarctica.AAC.6
MYAQTTKINGSLLLKRLAVSCALDSVGGNNFDNNMPWSGDPDIGYKENRDDGCYRCVPIGERESSDYYCERHSRESCGSCMSGNTGTLKATPGSFERIVAIVKELAVGDTIEGLDADKQPALCTVEAVGSFGHGVLYGNYTADHFVLDPATGNVTQHGAVGNRTVEDRYDVMTSCPVGLDETGTGFTPMDGGFCGKRTSEMGCGQTTY